MGLSFFRRKHHTRGSFRSLREASAITRCVSSIERLETRTLLSAVTFRNDSILPVQQAGTQLSIDVDLDFQIELLESGAVPGLQAEVRIENPDPGRTYVVELVAPNGSRSRLESRPDSDPGVLLFDRIADVSDLTGSTFGAWTFEVSPGSPVPDEDDDVPIELGGIVSTELRIVPVLNPPPRGSISGLIFDDFDGDQLRDDNEPGIGFVDLNRNGMFDGDEVRFTVFADLNRNGAFDAGEPFSQPDDRGRYEISDLASPLSYSLGLIAGDGTQTSSIGREISDEFGQPARFEFSSPEDSGGFLFDGLPLGATGPQAVGWQLSDDQQFADNHSHDFAAVFGKVLPNGVVEAVEPGSQGTLISPQFDLPETSDPIELEFQSFLVADGTDSSLLTDALSVSAVLPDGRTIPLTGPKFGLDTTTGFTQQNLDVSQLAGQTLQFEFTIETPAPDPDEPGTGTDATIQAWYLDDIAVILRDAPGAQIVHLNPGQRSADNNFAVASGSRFVGGTAFSDLNGDGLRSLDEPGLPGQVIVFDRDNDGIDVSVSVFETVVTSENADDVEDSLKVEIGDEISGTLLSIELVGQLRLRNPDVFEERGADNFGLALNSPFGQAQTVFGLLAPPEEVFESGELPAPATIELTVPEAFVSFLRTEPVNGTWELGSPNGDSNFGSLQELISFVFDAEVDSLGLRLTVVEHGIGPDSDGIVITDTDGRWQFNGLKPSDAATFEIVPSPATFRDAPKAVTFQTDPNSVDLLSGSFSDFNFGIAADDPVPNIVTDALPEVVPGESLIADIEYVTDRDVFRLPAATEGLVTLEVRGDTQTLTALNATVTVFTLNEDGQRNVVAFNDNSLFLLFGDFDARVQFNADPFEQYFVEIAASDVPDPVPFSPRQLTGVYELFASLEFPQPEADSADSADSLALATGNLFPDDTLPGQPVYQVGNIDYAADRDFYRVVAPGDGRLQIDLEDLNSSLAAQLTVFDGERQQIFQEPLDGRLPDLQTGLSRLPSFVLPVSKGDVLFVAASAVTTDTSLEFGAPTGQYLLTLELVTESEFDLTLIDIPDDGRRRARTGRIDFEGDIDAFDVRVPEVDSGFLELLLEPGLLSFLDAEFTVHRRNTGAKLIGSNDVNNSAFLTLGIGEGQPLSGGDELRVFVSDQERSRGGYSFATRYIAEDRTGRPGLPEPVAILPNAGLTPVATSRIDFAGDTDAFEFSIPANPDGAPAVLAVVAVERLDSVGVPQDSSDVLIDVVPAPESAGAVPVPADGSSLPEEFSFIAQTGAAYRVTVGLSGTQSGDFNVFVTLLDLDLLDDHGNSADDATVVEVLPVDDGAFAGDVEGILATPGDNDFFAFTPDTSGILEVEVSLSPFAEDIRPNDEFNLNISADPAAPAFASPVTSRVVSGGRRLLESVFALDAGRTYFFDVVSPNATAEYDLALEFLSDGAFGDRDVVLNLDNNFASVEGTVARSGSVFSQLVRPQNAGLLTVSLNTSSGLIPAISVFNADENGEPVGDPIATKRALRRDSRLDVQVASVENQNLAFTVGAAQPSDGDFQLSFRLDGVVADDVPDRPALTDPADDIEFAVDPETGEFLAVTLRRRLDFDADLDVFAFTAASSGRVSVNMNAPAFGPAPLDPKLAVFEVSIPSGTSRATIEVDTTNPLQFDDNSGSGLNAVLDFKIVNGRTYFIEAAAANSVAGEYEITFEPVEGDDFGDTLSAADQVFLNASGVVSRDRNGDGDVDDISESGRTVYGFLTADDTDVFRFDSTVTRQLLVSARGIVGNVIPELFLYRDDDDGLRRLVTTGTEEVVIDAVEGRPYYLRLDSRAITEGLYEVAIQPVDLTRNLPLVESLDVLQASGSVAGEIPRAGQADFYEFRVPFTGRVVAELSGVDGGLNPILTLLDSNRSEIAVNDNQAEGVDDSRLEFDVNARETFVLRAGLVGDQTGRYQLDVLLLPAPEIGDDPGGLIRDAAALEFETRDDEREVAVTSVVLAPVTPGLSGDSDAFSFIARTTGRVAAVVQGPAGDDVRLEAFRQVTDGPDLLIARGVRSEITLDVVRGETYAIKLTGRGTGELQAVLTPDDEGGAELEFLSDAIGIATTEALNAVFSQLASSGSDFAAGELLDAVLDEFFAAQGGQDNLQEQFLVFYSDPVDFVLEATSTGQQAGFTADTEQIDQFGNTFYSGDAINELLVLPQASAGRFAVELQGLGSDVRGGVALVNSSGVQTSTFEFDDLSDSRLIAIEFDSTDNFPARSAADGLTANGVAGEGVAAFGFSSILAALLGITELTGRGHALAVFTASRSLPPQIAVLAASLAQLADELTDFLLTDLGTLLNSSDGDPEDDDPPGALIQALLPGVSGVAEVMTQFGEFFTELLLTVPADNPDETPPDENPDTPSDPPDEDTSETGDAQSSEPTDTEDEASTDSRTRTGADTDAEPTAANPAGVPLETSRAVTRQQHIRRKHETQRS